MENKLIIVQGSKSQINRILLISTFLDSPLLIKNFSSCEDVNTMTKNSQLLGMRFERLDNNWMRVFPAKLQSSQLYIKDAGTAFRFLIARLAVAEGRDFSIDCSEQLKARPHHQLVDSLQNMGAEIGKRYPLKISGKKLAGGEIEISGNTSSQYTSSLLLCSPKFENGLRLKLSSSSVSKPYIWMTIEMMRKFGVEVNWEGDEIIVLPGQKYQNPTEIIIEPDYSTLSYFWVYAMLSGKEVITSGDPRKSNQADSSFWEVLKKFGAEVEFGNNLVKINCSKISGGEIDMNMMPDQVPTLALLALFADAPIYISGVGHLKYKESDRIKVLIQEFSKLTQIKYKTGILQINPITQRPKANINLLCYDDHRFVMTFSILQKRIRNIYLDNIDAVKKSAPEFFDEMIKLD